PNRTDWRKPESQIARKPTLNPRFLAKTVISDPLLRRPAQRRGGSSRPTRYAERKQTLPDIIMFGVGFGGFEVISHGIQSLWISVTYPAVCAQIGCFLGYEST